MDKRGDHRALFRLYGAGNAPGPGTGGEPRSESLMRPLRGTHGHHAASRLIMQQKTSAVRPAAIRRSNEQALPPSSPNPYILGLSLVDSTSSCPRCLAYIAHKLHPLI